jgi:hypothetical protein
VCGASLAAPPRKHHRRPILAVIAVLLLIGYVRIAAFRQRPTPSATPVAPPLAMTTDRAADEQFRAKLLGEWRSINGELLVRIDRGSATLLETGHQLTGPYSLLPLQHEVSFRMPGINRPLTARLEGDVLYVPSPRRPDQPIALRHVRWYH